MDLNNFKKQLYKANLYMSLEDIEHFRFSCYICYSRGVLSDDWSVSVCVLCTIVFQLLFFFPFQPWHCQLILDL